MTTSEQRVAVVIPTRDEQDKIAVTIHAARAISHVDPVVVVDGGSESDTQKAVRDTGVTVVRRSINRGKTSTMETGMQVTAMRGTGGRSLRPLLSLDADLGDIAAEVSLLAAPVFEGRADFVVAALPPQEGAGGFGLVTGAVFRATKRTTGWELRQPISGQRCMTRETFMAVLSLANGWGVGTGMMIDLLMARFTVQEAVCDLKHRASGNNFAGQLHRVGQHKGVAKAVPARRLRGIRVPHGKKGSVSKPYEPYNAYRGRRRGSREDVFPFATGCVSFGRRPSAAALPSA